MNKPRSKPADAAPPAKARAAAKTQPPPTGAHAASPAAPVMKQFSKTRRESGER
jgi:hypothetical protein